jgi:peptide/nickel transport system substrate-binding protein
MPAGPQEGLGYKDLIASVDVASKYQVVITLKHPFAPFVSFLAFAGSFIVNPKLAPDTPGKAVDYVDGNARASHPNDLGPYVLAEWSRKAGKDYEMKLDANPNYFGDAPKAKHVIFRFYSDATALALAIKSGDIDMAFRQLSATDIKNMQSDSKLKVWQGTGTFIQYIVFQEALPPCDNPAFRQAVAAALDRKQITDTIFLGQATPLYSMIPDGMAFHEDAFKTLGDANLTPMITLLRQMGYSEAGMSTMQQYGLAILVVGVIIAVAGFAMSTRKKT